MAVNSEKNYYINPKALSFTPNYQGYRNIVYVSIVSNAAIKAYHNDIDGLGYGMDAEYQTWRLSGTTTALGTASAYFIYARLSRTKQTADIIFSVRDYTVEGGYSYTDSEGNAQTVEKSDEYFYIKIGSLTETDIAGEDATINRVLTYVSGELGTDKQINEKSDSVFEQMFEFVSSGVEKLINVKQPFKSITVAGESLLKGLVTFVKGFVLGDREINAIATSEDDYNEDTKDSTLPTTGYVQKELEALDDHFLIKDDADIEQSVAGPVSFEKDVTVQGDHAVEGVQTIGKEDAAGNIDVNKVVQEVKGKQILHGGFQTPNFNNAAGQITGAHLTPDGKLYVSGLKANNFEIDQLIFNVIKAQGGEYVYSTSCEIESCIYVMRDGSQLTPDAFYTLPDHDWQQIAHVLITLKEDEFTQYGNPFVVGDIIYGKVNQVQESGKHAVGGECIMHITEVEDNTLNITAQLYQVGEHGLAGNIPPIEDMVIAHRGNKDGVQGRTTSFYLSTITGNLVMLYNVTTPTLSAANYGATFGKLPYDLYVQVLTYYAGLQPEDPAVYAKYLVTENWIQMDHLGQPIKFEVYRGDWRYDVAVSDKPYIVTLSTYDTVTHNGAKWRVVTSNTVTEPRDGYDDWERLTDANITVYALAPSSNIIYIRDAGVVTPSELDVTVKSTTSLGEEIISDQATLVSRNLTVWYTIDGGEERKMLVLGGTKVFVTEDGSSVFVTEAESVTSPLYLEGESIDLASVADNITLYLVEDYHDNAPDNAPDKASYVIPVVRDGAAPFGIEVTPSALSVPIDAETKATAGVRTFSSLVRLKQGKAYLEDVSEYSMSLLFTFGEETSDYPSQEYHQLIDYTIATDDNGVQYGWNILVESPDGVAIDKQLNRIDISVNHSNAVVATEAIQVVYLERGITGPAGKEGPMLYPCGTWKEGAEYKFTYQLNEDGSYATDSDGKYIILAKPFVYYEQDKNYYVLERDVEEGDSILVTNTEYWKPFTKIKYIFTEVLMANWAKLASAIFNGDYMFSMKGIDRLGNYGDYSAYQEGKDSMFDNIGEGENIHKRLNGNFVPNLFIDFKTGEAKMNRLSMPFYDLPYGGKAAYKIDLGVSHNVKADINKVVFLPNPTEIKDANGVVYDDTILSWQEKEADGVLCTIMAKPKPYYVEKYKTPIARFNMQNNASKIPSIYTLDDNLTLVCADGRLADYRSYKLADSKVVFNPIKQDNVNSFGQYDGKGYFLIEGVPVKFIVLEPGAILKLRSCYTTAGRYVIPTTGNGYAKESEGIFWVVENASDFAQINFTTETYLDEGEYQTSYVWSCPSNPDTDSPQLEIAYGSSFIRYVQSKGTDSLQSSDMLKAQLYVSNEGVGIEDSLFIEA